MKKRPIDRMTDPYYAGLIFRIEQMICLADKDAKDHGIQLTDSQVRSAILKARQMVKGDTPDIPETNKREQILAGLIQFIYHAPDEMVKQVQTEGGRSTEEPLPIPDWIKALETVEDSIKTRKSDLPGSRDYLTFLHGFVSQAEKMR